MAFPGGILKIFENQYSMTSQVIRQVGSSYGVLQVCRCLPAPGQFPWRSKRMRHSQNAPRCPRRPTVLPAGAQDSAPRLFMSSPLPRLSLQSQGDTHLPLGTTAIQAALLKCSFACLHVWALQKFLEAGKLCLFVLAFSVPSCLLCNNTGSLSETGPMTQLCAVRK